MGLLTILLISSITISELFGACTQDYTENPLPEDKNTEAFAEEDKDGSEKTKDSEDVDATSDEATESADVDTTSDPAKNSQDVDATSDDATESKGVKKLSKKTKDSKPVKKTFKQFAVSFASGIVQSAIAKLLEAHQKQFKEDVESVGKQLVEGWSISKKIKEILEQCLSAITGNLDIPPGLSVPLHAAVAVFEGIQENKAAEEKLNHDKESANTADESS